MILFDRVLNRYLEDHIHWLEQICLSVCPIFHIYRTGKMLLIFFVKQFWNVMLNNAIYKIFIVYNLLNTEIQNQSGTLCLETIWSKDLQTFKKVHSRFITLKRTDRNLECLNWGINSNRNHTAVIFVLGHTEACSSIPVPWTALNLFFSPNKSYSII